MSAALDGGVVFDTYAWVDYLAGGQRASRVSKILADKSYRQKVTPATAIAELTEKLLREGAEPSKIEQVVQFIASHTKIYPCDRDLATLAGQINFVQKKKVKDWGMLDSLNYAVANLLNCFFVTGDPHFTGKGDVIFLKR